MRILVVGSGGREHALVWKLAQSPRVKKLFAAPGNPGMASQAECVPLTADKPVELADFALSAKVDLTVVGPEAPLVHGIVDYFNERQIPIFGPTKAAARLEGSKAFAKRLIQRCGVPTADFKVFGDLKEALEYIQVSPIPVVVKADGLAAGKGSIVAKTREEAIQAVHRILGEKVFGPAGGQVVIEECLEGEEISVLALVDGTHLTLLSPSQDHKRAYEKDRGPNTGGMGAYCPVPMAEEKLLEEIRRTIFEPVVRGIAKEGSAFQGVLYAGLMLTAEGPQVLEFNVRFGDPEIQAILPRLKSDLLELILATMEGRLDRVNCQWDPKACVCVVLASGGYPEKYDIGREITGVKQAQGEEVLIFHAGTKVEGHRLLTWGGRVLNVVALGATLEKALERVYGAVPKISFEGMQYRRDIGARALKYMQGVGR